MSQFMICCIVLWLTSLQLGYGDDRGLHIPEGLTQEEYCSGCKQSASVFASKINHYQEQPLKTFPKLKKSCKEAEFNDTKIKKTCKHLVDKYQYEIEDEYDEVKDHFEKWLCVEQSFACMGVKEPKGDKQKEQFTDEDLAKLLEEHKGSIRRPAPVRPDNEL